MSSTTTPSPDPSAHEPFERRNRWDVTAPTVIDVAGVRRLSASVVSGAVDVLGRDEPGARIEVRAVSGRGVEIVAEDGELRIAHRPGGHRAHLEIAIAVQRDAVVDLRTVSAGVLVSGLRGGQEVETTSGEATLDATAGTALVRTVSGEVALREHAGAVEVRSVSGPVTASGPITGFSAELVSADLFLDAARPDELRVGSVSGGVVARLAADRPAEYTIRTVSGRVSLDGRDVPRTHGTHRSRYDGGEGVPVAVRVETASGSVRIVHADAG